MPIVVKTAEGNVGTEKGYVFHAMVLNMATALSEAIGASYGIIEGDTVSGFKEMRYYVCMDLIGYRGFCVCFRTFYERSSYYLTVNVLRTKDDNTPDFDDAYAIGYTFYGSDTSIANSLASCPETCVMIHDESKDTVLFDIHHGRDMHGEDIERDDHGFFIKADLFLAKDVKGGILCGLGAGYIARLRTMDASVEFEYGILSKNPQKNLIGPDVFHLTKMINYLDPSYPEMRSAYVSVVRPSNYGESSKRVTLLEVNGAKFGSAGNTDWEERYTVTDSRKCHFPINPFVNY